MWAPTDINALPTTEDLVNAKTAIEEIQRELGVASSPTRSSVRVDLLRINMRKLLAWVAPIRRAPLDILSLIFEHCGKEDWRSPLKIAEVSKQWKAIVLSTPRAWSYLGDTSPYLKTNTLQLYFERSAQCSLHLFFPSDGLSTSVLSTVAQRIHCLSCDRRFITYELMEFPVLTWLTLRAGASTDSLSHITVDRFPALRHLVCGSFNTHHDIRLGSSWVPPTFPPLQTLSLIITSDLVWLTVLQACRNTLLSLRMHQNYTDIPPSQRHVVLPALQCLEIQHWVSIDGDLSLDMRTPVLNTYIEHYHRPSNRIALHTDIVKIQKLRLNREPELLLTPSLCLLQIEDISLADTILTQLESNKDLCPTLKRIEICSSSIDEDGRFKVIMENINRGRSCRVELYTGPHSISELSGTVVKSDIGLHMPCNDHIPLD